MPQRRRSQDYPKERLPKLQQLGWNEHIFIKHCFPTTCKQVALVISKDYYQIYGGATAVLQFVANMNRVAAIGVLYEKFAVRRVTVG